MGYFPIIVRALQAIAVSASLTVAWVPSPVRAQGVAAGNPRYLLSFRALPPHEKRERNFYELSRDVTGFIDGHRFPPSGVITDANVRYGVVSVRKARLLSETDSRRSPQSTQDGTY